MLKIFGNDPVSRSIRLDSIGNLRGLAVSGVVACHFFVLLSLTQKSIFPLVHLFAATVLFIIILFSISPMSYYLLKEGGFTLPGKWGAGPGVKQANE